MRAWRIVEPETYVALTGQIEEVRRAISACLTNGAGDAPHPTQARSRSGGHSSRRCAQVIELVENIRRNVKNTHPPHPGDDRAPGP
jgi:hypothetical protein